MRPSDRRPSSRGPAVESLEQRRMMHAAVDIAINFGPKRVPGVEGYISDVGEVYGDRGDSMTFGWNSYNAANARDRNLLADQRLDTVTGLQAGGTKVWEIALPNGAYTVTVTSGDARFTDSVNVINVEGVNVIKTTPTAATPFTTKTRVVTVSDGRLTVRPGSGAVNAKINSIRIQNDDDDGAGGDGAATVSATAIDASVDEGTSNPGSIRLTRTGDAAASLAVNLEFSGAGGNKKDLVSPLPTSVTFAAGQTVIDLPIVARADGLSERPESVFVTVKSGTGYAASGTPAIATIVGQANPPATNASLADISWTTGRSSLSVNTEAQVAVVDGRLYRFGGYNGNYSAVRRVERFDPNTNSWTRFGDMPRGLSHSGAAVVGTKVWFAGAYAERVGSPGLQDIGIDTVYIYDSVADTWTTGPKLPAARGSGNMVNVNGTLYFVGGERTVDRAPTGTMWALNTANLSAGWVEKASLPVPRSHFGIAAVGGKIYCFGGQVGYDAGAVALQSTYAYDIATNVWAQRDNLPTAVSHIAQATVVYKGKIYSFGGDSPVYTSIAQAREYDPATDVWRTLTNIPSARLAPLAAVIGDTFYLHGGHTRSQEWTSDLFIGTVVK